MKQRAFGTVQVALAVAVLAAGCGSSLQSVPGQSVPGQSEPGQSEPGQSQPGQSEPGQSEPGQSEPGQSVPAGLPADWPPDLPVPAGTITGNTGSAGRWTVLILAVGSASQVRQSAVALYSAAGFTAVSDSVLNKGRRQITLVVENRDHSPSQTNLVVGVTTH